MAGRGSVGTESGLSGAPANNTHHNMFDVGDCIVVLVAYNKLQKGLQLQLCN